MFSPYFNFYQAKRLGLKVFLLCPRAPYFTRKDGCQEWIDIYFQASEGLYLYLDTRLNEGFEAA